MADTPRDDDDKNEVSLEISLEPASSIDSGAMGNSDMFAVESLAAVSNKLQIAESFFKLAAKDCKFNDFTRDLLFTTMRVLKSEAGSLFELDTGKTALFIRAAVGTSSDKISSFTVPVGTGIVGHVAESRQPMVVTDTSENRIHLKAIDDAIGFKTRNLVAIPIMVRGQLYGVLELLNRVGEQSFTEQDVELLNYCAEMAAKALEIRFMVAWAMGRKGTAA